MSGSSRQSTGQVLGTWPFAAAVQELGVRWLAGAYATSFLALCLIRLVVGRDGYFDSFYYSHVAESLARGDGMVESALITYIDDPTGLPRPAHQYWMPLASWLGWLGIDVLGWALPTHLAAEGPFVALAALLPPLAMVLSFCIAPVRAAAVAAGVVAAASPHYVTLWPLVDSFTPYAVAVALCCIACDRARLTGSRIWWVLAGLGAGLAHLTRIDGALVAIVVAWAVLAARPRTTRTTLIGDTAASAGGYLLVIGPWLLAQTIRIGRPFSGGGGRMSMLRSYDEFFHFKPDVSLDVWLDSGFGTIIGPRLQAMGVSAFLLTALSLGVLLPLVIGAVRPLRHVSVLQPFAVYGIVLVLAVPLIAPFPAMNGVIDHSGAALVAALAATVPHTLERLVRWYGDRQRLDGVARAVRIGTAAVVAAAVGFAGWVVADRAIEAAGERTDGLEVSVGAWLDQNADPSDRVQVRNPPNFTALTGREAVPLPRNGPDAAAQVAGLFDARWLVLDRQSAAIYEPMRRDGESASGWVERGRLVTSLDEFVIFEFRGDSP